MISYLTGIRLRSDSEGNPFGIPRTRTRTNPYVTDVSQSGSSQIQVTVTYPDWTWIR